MPEPLLDCRFQSLDVLLSLIDDDPGVPAGPCDQPAAFSTFVVRKREGQDVEIYTRTCEAHDQLAHGIPGYGRSVRLRQPAPS